MQQYTEEEKKQWAIQAFKRALSRARTMQLEFTIKLFDIPTPADCPVLGTELCYEIIPGNPPPRCNAPALCRRDHSRGYTPDNVLVLSALANSIQGTRNFDAVNWRQEYEPAAAGISARR